MFKDVGEKEKESRREVRFVFRLLARARITALPHFACIPISPSHLLHNNSYSSPRTLLALKDTYGPLLAGLTYQTARIRPLVLSPYYDANIDFDVSGMLLSIKQIVFSSIQNLGNDIERGV